MKVAFLGSGNMGSALVQGGLKSGILKASQVQAYDVKKESLGRLKKKTGIKAASSNAGAVRGSDYVFLCVKPQQMRDLLAEIKDEVGNKPCLISIAAGVTTGSIEKAFYPRKARVIRVMPNTPALIGKGMAAVTRGRFAAPSDARFAVRFFSSVGKAVVLPERLFDAVTAVSGSGPAYVFYLAESLQKACKALGLPKAAAETLFKQTVMGAGMMLGNARSPEELRLSVTSPGGTTESALRHLEKKKWSEIFVQAVKKARDRSRELKS